MMRENKQVLKRIAQLQRTVRKKYNKLRMGITDTERLLEQQYKPLISELKKTDPKPEAIKTEIKHEDYPEFRPTVHSSPNRTVVPLEVEETFETSDPTVPNISHVLSTEEGLETASRYVGENFAHPLTQRYMLQLFKDVGGRKRTIDHTFGPRFEGDVLMVGDKPLSFEDSGSIVVAETVYKPTEGLYELVFKRIPDDEVYDEQDLAAYKDILLKSNAHRKNYNPRGNVNRDNSLKYRNVIAGLFPKQLYGGQGLLTKSITRPGLTYWNDVNELVDRLRLLVASTEAGNSSHRNEIISIIEELREDGYIKGRGNARFKALLRWA